LSVVLLKRTERRKTRQDETRQYDTTRQERISHVETNVPAIQAEQDESDVAPMTAEYVPAKAMDKEYAQVDSKLSA
jgi:hypothetical protein